MARRKRPGAGRRALSGLSLHPEEDGMNPPHFPDSHHLQPCGVACLACQRARRIAGGDWPPPWHHRHGEPWSWGKAERFCWAPEWRKVRLLLGSPA
jgi:hypothetical protein